MKIQWIIFVTFIIILIQGYIYRRWALKGLGYMRYFSKASVFEGQEVEMVERISNRKILPLPWLRIESKISEYLEFQRQFNLDIKHHQFHKSIFSLMPYTAINRRHTIRCKKRGLYRLNSAALTCGDLFGFQDISRTYELGAELLVYPRIVPLGDIPYLSRSWLGDVSVKRWIIDDPFMYQGVREYIPGDPLKDINWKATARAGTLQVHKRDYTSDPRIMIYLNMDISEEMWGPITEPKLIELGISYAASIAREAISRGIETGFGTNGYLLDDPKMPLRVLPRGGERHLLFLYESMSKLAVDRCVTFHTFLDGDIGDRAMGSLRGSIDYLFITAFLTERLQNQIKQLEDMGNTVEILWLKEDEKGAMAV